MSAKIALAEEAIAAEGPPAASLWCRECARLQRMSTATLIWSGLLGPVEAKRPSTTLRCNSCGSTDTLVLWHGRSRTLA
jgi:hypothetical protein